MEQTSPIETPYDQRVNRLQRRSGRDNLAPEQRARMKLRLAKAEKRQFNFTERNKPREMPYSAGYESDVSSARNTYNQQQASFAGQRAGIEGQYGFGADTSNPFSVARQLEQNYQKQRAGTGNSFARQGQLYAGSLSNARNIDATGMERGMDTAMREYQAALGGVADEELQAGNAYRDALAAAEAARLEGAVNTPLDPTTAPQAPNFGNRIARLKDKIKKQPGRNRR